MEQISAPKALRSRTTVTDSSGVGEAVRSAGQAATVLLSVVDAAEAALVAAEVPQAMIDLKNPAAGSLGRPAEERLIATLAALPDRILSVASGDIDDLWPPLPPVFLSPSIAFLKFGVQRRSAWNVEETVRLIRSSEDCRDEIPAASSRDDLKRWVACFYVDINDDGRPRDLVDTAELQRTIHQELLRFIDRWSAVGGRRVLIDTAIKQGHRTLDYVSASRLSKIFRSRQSGCEWMLAGALRLEDWCEIADCGAAVIGFRSAICCDRARQGAVDRSKLQMIQNWSAGSVDRVGRGGSRQDERESRHV